MPQPTARQLIIRALYHELKKFHTPPTPQATPQVNAFASEGVMAEEKRAVPVFFRPGDGIYARLLKRYPEFNPDFPAAKAAEDQAIADMISEITRRLAQAKDRLNEDKVVGQQAAQEAAGNPKKRYRREYRIRVKDQDSSCFDDIGRCHSALRIILNDDTLYSGTPAAPYPFTTRYFDGNNNYYLAGSHGAQNTTYRHFLALIWKGITENGIKAPINFTENSSKELREMAIEQFISVMAQCRREHNFDARHPDWDQTEKPQDAQRCDTGLRGDLFGQLLIYNEYYMQTRDDLNVEQLESLIKDMIFEEFIALKDLDLQEKIIRYLDDKAALVDSDKEATDALDAFIRTTKIAVYQNLIAKLQSTSPNPHLYKLHAFLRTIDQKAAGGNAGAIEAQVNIRENLDRWVNLEVESLKLMGSNLASMDFISPFATYGLAQILKTHLTAVLTGKDKTQEQEVQLTTRIDKVINQVLALQYRVDVIIINADVFTDVSFSAKQQQYLQFVKFYVDKVATIEKLILEACEQSQQEMAQQFSFFGDPEVARTVEQERQKFQQRILNRLAPVKAQLTNLNQNLSINNLDAVRPYLKVIITAYPDPIERRYSPDFYADYLWRLLLEESHYHNYLINDVNNTVFRRTLDLIFGNESTGVKGLQRAQQTLVMYAFNARLLLEKNTSPDNNAKNNITHRWGLVEAYLQEKQISLQAPWVTPGENLISLTETRYKASKISFNTWRNVITHSGQQTALENATQECQTAETKTEYLRQQVYYPAIIMDRAASSPLTLYDVKDPTRQNQGLVLWKAIALSMFTHIPKRNNQHVTDLVNFVTQSIMIQLSINTFSREDQTVLKQIVEQYMGIKAYVDFPLPFQPAPGTSTEQRIDSLAKHLVLLITTLNSKAVKACFESGMLRLMSYTESTAIINKDKHKDKYILRLSNSRPNVLILTTRNASGEVIYEDIVSEAQQEIKLENSSYKVSTFPNDTLATAVFPHIDLKLKYVICMMPSPEEKQQFDQEKIYLAFIFNDSLYTLNYKVRLPSGEVASGGIALPRLIKTVTVRELREIFSCPSSLYDLIQKLDDDQNVEFDCLRISPSELIRLLNYDLKLQKSLIVDPILAQGHNLYTKSSIVPNLTLALMTNAEYQIAQNKNFQNECKRSRYDNDSPPLLTLTLHPPGLREAMNHFYGDAAAALPNPVLPQPASTAQQAAVSQEEEEQKSSCIMMEGAVTYTGGF